MGRLTIKKPSYFLHPWALPVVASISIVTLVHIFFIQAKPPSRSDLEGYLSVSQLAVDSEIVNGYQQIYYIYNDVKVYLTAGQQNHYGPVANGRYIAWLESINGSPQLFRYDLLDNTKLQLSYSGVNSNPQPAAEGRVSWQRITTTVPQRMQFDGISVRQL